MAGKKKNPSLLRGLLVPRWSRLIPHGSNTETGLSARAEASLLARALGKTSAFGDTTLKCPKDGTPMTLATQVEYEPDGLPLPATPVRAFECPKCGGLIHVADLISDAQGQLDYLKKQERQYIIYGLVMALIFGIISFLNKNHLTFIGGMTLAFILVSLSLVYRYRYWQVVKRRLFEGKAPILDWLRDEFRN